jgi:CsoR family transcriptional regulator, copper-sensing transcriptional repressor
MKYWVMTRRKGAPGSTAGNPVRNHLSGHGAPDERKPIAVDPEIKRSALHRLRRIEGQVRGIQNMVEQERYCADVLVQLSAVTEALRNVGREILKNHLKHCATHAITQSPERAEAMYNELVELFSRYAR